MSKTKKDDAANEGGAPVLRVMQTGSPIGRVRSQRQTLVGLGLNKINRSRLVADTPATRGMIRRVAHLVRVDKA